MRYQHRTILPVDSETLYQWLSSTSAFQRLNPPFEQVDYDESQGRHPGVFNDALVHLKLKLPLGLSMPWVLRHTDVEAPHHFVDKQVLGPFARWTHWHRVQAAADENTSILTDEIIYDLPFGFLVNWLGYFLVNPKLKRLFDYRQRVMMHELSMNQQYSTVGGAIKPMKILVSGASGLVGSALIAALTTQGHQVIELRRKYPGPDQKNVVLWDPEIGNLNPTYLEGLDAVVHLAGENIADGRWTEHKKKQIVESRVKGTKLLCEALATLKQKPKVLVSASAIGYYGNRGEERLTEDSPMGQGFLPDTCHQWEAATQAASDAGIRVVNPRIGVVLTPKGGALQKMLLPFLIGAGGTLGFTGKQQWSWVAIDDLVGGIIHALNTESLAGPVNLVAPNPVSNKTFTQVLAKVLFRPALAPVPDFMLRLLLGEMADALLLSSTNVSSQKLEASGYKFAYPQLEQALRHVLGKA